jgi:hypothetical protein
MNNLSYRAGVAVMLAATAIPAQSDATTPGVEPASIEALRKMGAYLRTLEAFQITATTTVEDVRDDGLKVQHSGKVCMLAQMPDRLRMEVDGDRQHRFYFYNGKQFTIWAQRVNYYATVPAPSTTAKLLDVLDDKYDINIPLTDLFHWGTERSDPSALTAAVDIGPSSVEGTPSGRMVSIGRCGSSRATFRCPARWSSPQPPTKRGPNSPR